MKEKVGYRFIGARFAPLVLLVAARRAIRKSGKLKYQVEGQESIVLRRLKMKSSLRINDIGRAR